MRNPDDGPPAGPHDDAIDWNLIERVVAADAAPSDRARLDRWVGDDLARRALIERCTEAVAALRHGAPRYDAAPAWSELARRLGRQPRSVGAGGPPLPRVIAASMAAAALVGALWIAASSRGAARSLTRIAPPPVVAGRGQRVTVRLSDGSRVILAPQSQLTLDSGFGGSRRAVALSGRAYFDVVHDGARPFTVAVAGARIRDIGTAFEVDAYGAALRHRPAGGAAPQVIVAEGSVLLEAIGADTAGAARAGASTRGESSVLVSAGQIARVDGQRRTATVRDADVAAWLSWTRGDLTFEDVPLGDALQELERWYDIDIAVADTGLARRHITATFHDETLPHVLRSLALVLHAHYEWADHTVTLTPAPQTAAGRGDGGA